MSAAAKAPQYGSLVERMVRVSAKERLALFRSLPEPAQRGLAEGWTVWAHLGQLPPDGDWRVWLLRAGRGFGKTLAGAQWVTGIAHANPNARIALVGASADEVRQVMVEGESGLLAVAPEHARPMWKRDAGEVVYANGARATVFGAEAPERLRGPEHHAAWCDELAKWRNGDATWDNLAFGLRMGARPQALVTTTPRPVALLRRVMALPGTVETHGRTQDNAHLPPAFVAEVEALYAGTRLGRQELDGELIEEVEGALWSRAGLELARIDAAPALVRVVVGVDPPAGATGDACGIVAVALGADGIGYVLEDASVERALPETWARAVAGCAQRHGADRVVAEANNGGEMVASVLRAADAGIAVRLVHASHGKVTRAEPVAMLYERGRVRHVGTFPALEDEMAGLLAGGGYAGPGRSPDRADALVWALSELLLGKRGVARVRVV